MEQTLIRPYTIERPLNGAKVRNYLLLRELGRGGYAHVYLAKHLYLKHQAALKLLNLSLPHDEDLVRFQFEARLLAQLRHRHIVRALDFGWERDTPFLAMDYAPGGTFQQAFQQGVSQTIDAAFTHFPSLTTNHLVLRHIQPSDAEDLFATFSDEETMQFTGHGPYQLEDETRRFIEQIQTRYARREAIRWGITLKGENRVIGSCGFHDFDAGFHRAETGYELNRAFWNQGLMTEAMSAILAYGFTDLNLHRIEASIDMTNEASKALLLKLGFTYEGNLRQRYAFRGRFGDQHFFGLLQDEWLRSV